MRKKYRRAQFGDYMIFVFPTFVFLVFVELIPFINGIGYSFTDWNGISKSFNYVGFENYIESLLPGSNFWQFFWTTIKIVFVTVPAINILAFLFANILNSPAMKSRNIARISIFTPKVISATIIAFLWKFIFSICFSKIGDATGIGLFHISWLGTPINALWAVIIVAVWADIGFYMVIYIAGLQSIDSSYIESSMIDGASPFQQIMRIKLPMVMNSITICIFLTLSNTFRLFDIPYLLTSGGPGNSTTTLAIDIYKQAFGSYHQYGVGTTHSIILFVFLLIVTLLQVNFTKGKEVEQ